MGMRLIDRVATANFFRVRAVYLMMLRALERNMGEDLVKQYKFVTYVPVGESASEHLNGRSLCASLSRTRNPVVKVH